MKDNKIRFLTRKKLGYIQKCMYEEKRQLRIILWSFIVIIIIIMGGILWSNRNFLFGKEYLNTSGQIKSFMDSNFTNAELHYNSSLGLIDTFLITTTSQQQMVILGSGGGMALPTRTTKSDNLYYVYLLECEDAYVLLCSQQEKEFTNANKVEVRKQYEEIMQDIKRNLIGVESDFSKDVYVLFYQNSNWKINFGICLIIALGLIGILQFIKRSKRIQRNSRLAQKLRKLGNYEEIFCKINEQVQNPIFKASSYQITKDYLIIDTLWDVNQKVEVECIPKKSIIKMESYEHPKYPEIIRIEISYKIEEEICKTTLQVYEEESREKILEALNQ